MTLARVVGFTSSILRKTRETVDTETPAARATSAIVTRDTGGNTRLKMQPSQACAPPEPCSMIASMAPGIVKGIEIKVSGRTS